MGDHPSWYYKAVIAGIIMFGLYKITELVMDRQAEMLKITLQSTQQVIEK